MSLFRDSVPFSTLAKALAIVTFPAFLVLLVLLGTGTVSFHYFMLAYGVTLAGTAAILHPFLANLTSLTRYVLKLAADKKSETPRLAALAAVGELSDAVGKLQRSWEMKKLQMETVIADREVLVDTLPDILVMINDSMVVMRTNSAARSIFGQNLSGKVLSEVIPCEALWKASSATIHDFRSRELEFHLDEPFPCDYHASIKRFTGQSAGSAGSITSIITLNDITELKRAEQMRADFVANASHEIRTPLASIRGFIETLQQHAKDDPDARDEFLRIMSEQADRMTRLISDLLSLSKIEMNAHSIPTAKVDMLKIVRTERENIQRAAETKRMIIRLELHDNLPAVRGEESELAQVVHNLLGNAVKYGNPETAVTVTARATSSFPPEMRLMHGSINRAVSIAFQDQGEGIPRQHLPRLTERFYRVDSARTRKVGGTGLGLAIVKHILNRHQGVLAIDSVVGEGSVFTVYLPIHQEE